MKIEISGLEELQNELERMKENAEELSGTTQVPFSELFPTSFMRKYTQFSSMDEMLIAGSFDIESQEDFEAIPEELLDKHIAASTRFTSWEAMLEEATTQYVAKKLGF